MTDGKRRDTLRPLFTWRAALCSEHGPKSPVTRHVLLTLSLYMSERGDSCFPSVETLVTDTALSKPSVIKHLQLAESEGWIVRTLKGVKGQGWRHHEYRCRVPANVVKEINRVAPEGGKPRDERGKAHTSNVVKEVNPITPMITPEREARAHEGQELTVRQQSPEPPPHPPARQHPETKGGGGGASLNSFAKHPAVAAYRITCGSAILADRFAARIAGAVGDKPEDVDAWKDLCLIWAESPKWNHRNVGKMIDAFKEHRTAPASKGTNLRAMEERWV